MAAGFALTASAPAANALVINTVFDSSITSRSNAALIESDVNAAASQFDGAFANAATVTIDVSWGSVAGQALGAGDISGSLDNLSGPYTFAQLTHYLALTSRANPGDQTLASEVSHLPATDPTHLNAYEIPYAEAQAMGLLSPHLATAAGYLGFSSTAAFDFNPADGTTAGQYDFEAAAAHEIEEVLGTITGLTSTKPTFATPFDLGRYSAAGVSSFAYGAAAYYSVDGGTTDVGNFNYTGSGDRSDWLTLAGATDLRDAYLSPGITYTLSQADLTTLDALGWGSFTPPNGLLTATPGMHSGVNGAGGAVPEPATWAMMILGVGMVGGVMRRQQRLAREALAAAA